MTEDTPTPPSRTVVAVAQFAPGMDKAANLDALRSLATEAAVQGAKVVVAPEYSMYTAPRTDERLIDTAEDLDGTFGSGLAAIAADLGIFLVAGMNERLRNVSRISNTLVAMGPGGELAATYRKLHLYDAFGYLESAVIAPGEIDEPQTFLCEGLTFGLQTCYDLRFPEVTRRIVDAGADVLLLPAQWVPGPLKEDHWTTLIRARAIENTMYIAAADQSARGGAGASMIVDPMGVVLCSLGEQVGVASTPVSSSRIHEVRQKNPALALRRFTIIER
ncbi:carbon-nitrogen hydrolase family protein [Rhodococcus sp. IEGM 1379]|uniref:carbon-nitrogen hydrolase family protein n=1 Tax=Rhodococcus sp. IEGM 1379 TaxID=3047086 RepID=UPI0024B7DC77|nr:carbon-nitrogen hydrolase family protein [Rhodococcus sp. IEGM 1379]MDI9915748.1 carbon-nitrogen hydrolase family protein [Rhodococcus sp. IEGM 1379]